MPGDYSRFTFDPKKRFAEVLAQQGRVDLDSDRNELVEILTRADRLRSWDTFGNAAVPKETTPDAFKIKVLANDFGIGVGRMYVDGILIEAFNADVPALNHQPFWKIPVDVTKLAGQWLAYVDVWQREITYIEDPALLDSALGGVDTATRTQNVWQVKLKQNLQCDSDLSVAFPPTDATLSVSVVQPKDPPDPCLLPETGGFTDIENRHYRVEIHVRPPADPKPGTFIKFSRDPIAIEIEKIEKSDASTTTFLVKSIGRDSVLRISKGDTVEFLNEHRVLHGIAGTIAAVDDVDDGARLVKVHAPITAVDVAADLRPRLVIWHQKEENGELLMPLDTSQPVELEAGIFVHIKGTTFHHGDYWMFPARAATHAAGPLENAPPRGIVHHYAPLATITFPSSGPPEVKDCRTLWPAECDCECEACVNPDDHESGHFTIQMAIDKVKKGGGGKVCVKPGLYEIDTPIEISETNSLWLTGHGKARIEYTGQMPYVILVDQCTETVVEGLTIVRPGGGTNPEVAGVLLRDCWLDVAVRNCWIEMVGAQSVGVALEGAIVATKVTDCVFSAARGIGVLGKSLVSTAELLEVASNVFLTRQTCVTVDAVGVAVTIRDNFMLSFEGGGVRLEGTTDPAFANRIENNDISSEKEGIRTHADRTTIAGNSVRGRFVVNRNSPTLEPVDDEASGIAVYSVDGSEGEVEALHVVGNRIREVHGCGILVGSRVDGGMIKQNFIEQTAGGGIVVTEAAARSRLSIENNDLRAVALGARGGEEDRWFGIYLAPSCEAAVVENVISGVGRLLSGTRAFLPAFGIFVDVLNVTRVHGNRVTDVTPSAFGSAGIYVVPPVRTVDVTNNIVDVTGLANADAHCFPLRVQTLARDFAVLAAPNFAAATRAANTGGFRVLLWADADFPLVFFPDSRPVLNVRTNELSFEHVGQKSPACVILVESPELHCTVGGNFCTWTGETQDGVKIAASTVAVDGNQILGPSEVSLFVNTTSADKKNPRWAVIGNVCENGMTLEPPDTLQDWRKLNRLL